LEQLSAPLSQLRTLASTVERAFGDKDVEALDAVYAPGKALFVFDVVGPPGTYLSWEAYREALTHFFAAFNGPLQFTMSDLEIEATGDVGYGRSLQHVSGIRAKDGKPLDYTVRVTNVYRKIGGKWLIVQEHVSLPLDRNTFAPLLHGP
jgi:ketosteroid isomerase-like protein